jgi:hypothetical protein
MSYTLSMSNVRVGRSELEVRDADRRVARGTFRPGLGYELAQPVFELFQQSAGDASALDRYRRAREALRLRLTDASGAVIAVREVHIRRKTGSTAGTDEYVIEVESDDPSLWTPRA